MLNEKEDALALIAAHTVIKLVQQFFGRCLRDAAQHLQQVGGKLGGARGFAHKVFQSVQHANARAYALGNGGELCSQLLHRYDGLLHGNILAITGRLLAEAHKGGSQSLLQVGILLQA